MWDPEKRPLSRRGRRRAKRLMSERRERLRALCTDRDLTSVVWRTVARDPTFGFTNAERWHGIVFDEHGDFVATMWDVVPVDAAKVELMLIEQLEHGEAWSST